MKVNFYTFAKRINSTKQPTGTGTEYDVTIKRGSSVIAPTIELDAGLATSPANLNYAYISDWGRYYFVSDWVFNERLWTAKLTVDPLASFKTSIGSYSGYILRSASSYDGDIVDTLYPALADVSESALDPTSGPSFTHALSSGTYVVGIMGKNNGQNGGAVTYYALSAGAMNTLCNYLLNIANYSSIQDIEADLLKCIFNPLQYIVSCMWFPFNIAHTESSNIDVGWWTVTLTGVSYITDPLYTRNLTFSDIPKHPQAATRGNYLNMPPFSRYWLIAGPWGIIPLDNSNLLNETGLSAALTVDLFTGSGRFSIVTKDVIAYTDEHICQVGVPIQLGQNMLNQGALQTAVGGGISTIKSMMSGDPLGMLGSGMQTIGSAAELSQSIPSMIGSNGTIAFNNIFRMVGRFFKVANEDLASRGRPLCQAKTISSLSGYILCSDADPDIACTDSELKQIVSYMNGGFYYE